jgi:hypothetical protein
MSVLGNGDPIRCGIRVSWLWCCGSLLSSHRRPFCVLIDDGEHGDGDTSDNEPSMLAVIKEAPGNVSLETMLAEIGRLLRGPVVEALALIVSRAGKGRWVGGAGRRPHGACRPGHGPRGVSGRRSRGLFVCTVTNARM